MKCSEFERLVDAYLDGELSSSLRLEFDAHRLHCRRCQLLMVMMEAVETVVASDNHEPRLSDDFTERVMAGVKRSRPASLRLRPTRVAVAVAALLQAAAVLYLAVSLPGHGPAPGPTSVVEMPAAGLSAERASGGEVLARFAEADSRFARREALYDEIIRRIEAARANLASDLTQLARYASGFSVPEDVARASASNPLSWLLEALVPRPEPVEPEPARSADYQAL